MCGRATDVHCRLVRFRLPDPVLHSPAQECAEGSWLSHADAASFNPHMRAVTPPSGRQLGSGWESPG